MDGPRVCISDFSGWGRWGSPRAKPYGAVKFLRRCPLQAEGSFSPVGDLDLEKSLTIASEES